MKSLYQTRIPLSTTSSGLKTTIPNNSYVGLDGIDNASRNSIISLLELQNRAILTLDIDGTRILFHNKFVYYSLKDLYGKIGVQLMV